MFAPTRYLTWARRFYGKVSFDLASSGMPAVASGDFGSPAALDDPRGWERARAAVARYNDVPANEAIVALGTTHALFLAYAALLSPGDEVLVESPGYEPLSRIAEGLGANVRTFERPKAARFALLPDRVEAALTPKTRVVAVSNLHNPTGVRTSDDVLAEVAAVAARHGATLLVDEVYAPFDALVGADGVFHGSARRLAPNIAAVGSLTKCYGLGGDRFGWMLAAPGVIARADDAVTASCGMLPLSHANLAVHAFERLGPHLADLARHRLGSKRERVAAWAREKKLDYTFPDAGLFGFVSLSDRKELVRVVEEGAATYEVLVAPGEFFGAPYGFRLAWSLDEGKLDEALERLGLVVETH